MTTDECAICLDSLFMDARPWGVTLCGHVFHQKCFADYAQSQPQGLIDVPCPMCNQPTKRQITKVFVNHHHHHHHQTTAHAARVAQLQAQLDQVKAQNAHYQSTLNAQNAHLARMETNLQHSKTYAANLQNQLNEARRAGAANNSVTANLQTQLGHADAKLGRLYKKRALQADTILNLSRQLETAKSTIVQLEQQQQQQQQKQQSSCRPSTRSFDCQDNAANRVAQRNENANPNIPPC